MATRKGLNPRRNRVPSPPPGLREPPRLARVRLVFFCAHIRLRGVVGASCAASRRHHRAPGPGRPVVRPEASGNGGWWRRPARPGGRTETPRCTDQPDIVWAAACPARVGPTAPTTDPPDIVRTPPRVDGRPAPVGPPRIPCEDPRRGTPGSPAGRPKGPPMPPCTQDQPDILFPAKRIVGASVHQDQPDILAATKGVVTIRSYRSTGHSLSGGPFLDGRSLQIIDP